MKRLLSTLTAVAMTASMVTGCASNSVKSETPEGVQKVPVSQIWDGYEDLQGKDLGVIKLPEKIEKQAAEKYYALELIPRLCEPETASAQFFKAFYKDKFDESKCVSSDTGAIIYDDPDVGNGIFIRVSDNDKYGGPGPTTLYGGIDDRYDILAKYYAGKDDAVKLDLAGGSCTVGELAETVDRFMKEGLYPLYDSPDLPMKPYYVLCIGSKSDNKPKKAIVTCAYSYGGLGLQSNTSGVSETMIFAGHEVSREYTGYTLSFDLESKDKITEFAGNILPYDPVAEELTELVPLSNAVELLKQELAVNSRYEFDKVELTYCMKVIQPKNYGIDPEYDAEVVDAIDKALDPIDKKLVPTWCFEWTGYDANGAHDCFIKVNAVTGEITIDAMVTSNKPLDNSSSSSEESTSSEAEETASSEDSEDSGPYFPAAKPNFDNVPKDVPVDVISYDGKTLTYEYEGKTESAEVEPGYLNMLRPHSTRILNNKYGIKVKGIFEYERYYDAWFFNAASLNGTDYTPYWDSDPIKECDEETLKAIYSNLPDDIPHELVDIDPGLLSGYSTARRIKGSIYEVSNIYGTEQIDLNDLDYHNKGNYPDEIKGANFLVYKFNDGGTILRWLSFVDNVELDKNGNIAAESSTSYDIRSLPMFAGKIQSLTEDRAVVMLNDGKTTCDVPTYFNDGELKEGMNVMLTLEAKNSLFGSGEQYKAEYAVFTTHIEDYIEGYTPADHSKIAYAKMDEHWHNHFNPTMIDDIKHDK